MNELIKPPQPNISKEFLVVFNQIVQKSTEPTLIIDLIKEPSQDELKFIVDNYSSEIGLARLNNNEKWMMIKGRLGRFPLPAMIAKKTSIIAHTHPSSNSLPLPSPEDTFFAMNLKNKEFIIHRDGITYFTGLKIHPTSGKLWTPKDDFQEIRKLDQSFVYKQIYRLNHDTEDHRTYRQAYKEDVLDKMGITVIQKVWKELPENNPLSQFPFRVAA